MITRQPFLRQRAKDGPSALKVVNMICRQDGVVALARIAIALLSWDRAGQQRS